MTPRPLPPELRDELAQRTEGHELMQVWELLTLADPVAGAPEADAVWARVQAQIAAGQPLLTPLSSPVVTEDPSRAATSGSVRSIGSAPSRRRLPAPAWAAAATLALAVGLGSWASRTRTVIAPAGSQVAVTLPDGSMAELNAGSTLRYRAGFRTLGLPVGTRTVSLDGEAFFSVTRDGRAFSVRTADAEVRVLGTRFLVRAHADDPDGTRVAVEEGRVRVTGASASVELTAGEGTVVARGTRSVAPATAVGVERLTLWRRGGFALIDQPIDAIVREIERRYAVSIQLRDVPIGEERLTLYYPERPSIETVLGDLCTPRDLRYVRTSRGFEISPSVERLSPVP